MNTGNVIRADIRALAAYDVPSADGMVKLDAMENPFPLPPGIREALGRTVENLALNRYPAPSAPALKRCLREMMELPSSAAMILGNGSDELIQMLALAVATPDAVIMGVEPSFVMFHMIARLARVRFVGVPLKSDFSLDGAALLGAIAEHRPALIFLAYPNNPTGNCFDESIMEAVLKASTGLVVVDEAYYPFTPRSFKRHLGQYPNLLLMRTLSKLGLAGVRLGWLCGPEAVVNEIEKVRLPYNISVLDQAAAVVVLEQRAVLQEQVQEIVHQREYVRLQLAALSGVEVFPSEANFLLFRVPEAARIFDGLRQHGILIKNLTQAHSLLHDCLRVTVGASEENQAFLSAIKLLVGR
ncbi:MAG: histidinol-phosphate transaminase [Ferrovum sp.]|nr:histidinol-phosphate transaminase [Ferrovum sp.]NDU87563.1 histidinol-phosphate transaminase [Ferrovum sp.]